MTSGLGSGAGVGPLAPSCASVQPCGDEERNRRNGGGRHEQQVGREQNGERSRASLRPSDVLTPPPDRTSEDTRDELIEAHAVSVGGARQLLVEIRRHAQQQAAAMPTRAWPWLRRGSLLRR